MIRSELMEHRRSAAIDASLRAAFLFAGSSDSAEYARGFTESSRKHLEHRASARFERTS